MDFDWTNKTILIAEDEPANFLFMEKIIQPTNAKVLRAHDGAEAIDMVNSNETIDLVLMDIYMPEMDGFDAAAVIRETKPNLPIIAQTCYESQIEPEKLEKADFNGFIRKPINITKLLVVIERHLGDGALVK